MQGAQTRGKIHLSSEREWEGSVWRKGRDQRERREVGGREVGRRSTLGEVVSVG